MEDFAKLIKKIDDFFRDFFDMRESYFMTQFPSVPLEFPKLANAQPSNFGPLRILKVCIIMLDQAILVFSKKLNLCIILRLMSQYLYLSGNVDYNCHDRKT